MKLENLVRKTKRGVLASALGLTMAMGAYGCGEDEPCKKEVVYEIPNSLYGIYNMEYTETEDTHDMLEDTGSYQMEILTLGSDAKLRFGIFATPPDDFDRDVETGEVCKSWTDEFWGDEHYVCGNISDDGEVNLEASIEFYDWDGSLVRVAIDTWGNRDPVEEE